MSSIFFVFFILGKTVTVEPQHLASLGSLLDDQHWHHVAVELHNHHLNLTVDKHTLSVKIPSEFHHLDIEEV